MAGLPIVRGYATHLAAESRWAEMATDPKWADMAAGSGAVADSGAVANSVVVVADLVVVAVDDFHATERAMDDHQYRQFIGSEWTRLAAFPEQEGVARDRRWEGVADNT